MFSGRHQVETKDGAVVLDKDPRILKLVLSYLKKLNLRLHPSDKQLVEMELDYWGLPPLGYEKKLLELQNLLSSKPSGIVPEVLSIWK